jgi:hypothetical protein
MRTISTRMTSCEKSRFRLVVAELRGVSKAVRSLKCTRLFFLPCPAHVADLCTSGSESLGLGPSALSPEWYLKIGWLCLQHSQHVVWFGASMHAHRQLKEASRVAVSASVLHQHMLACVECIFKLVLVA